MNEIIYKFKKSMKYLFHRKVKKNNNPIKWGIIGTGYMAEVLATAIDANKDGIISAVASRTIKKAGQFANIHKISNKYCSYEELTKDKDIDVIYIATPTIHHYEHIKLCLQQGKNVLCEKPITSNAAQLNELIVLAKEKKCFLMEGMWMKCLPVYQKAFQWINEGKIGNLELIKVDFYKREQINPSKDIFNKKLGGGVLLDYGIYAISFPIGFMNDNIKINGYSRNSFFGVDSDWMIYMKSDDIQAFVNISSDFLGSSKAAVIGQQGSIEWSPQFNRTNTLTLYDKLGRKVDEFKTKYYFEGFEYEINDVQHCIRNKLTESSFVSLNSSLNVMKIVDLLKRENVEHEIL